MRSFVPKVLGTGPLPDIKSNPCPNCPQWLKTVKRFEQLIGHPNVTFEMFGAYRQNFVINPATRHSFLPPASLSVCKD